MQDSKSIYIYGINPVKEAIRAGRPIEEIYVKEGRKKGIEDIEKEAENRSIPIKEMPNSFFEERFPKGHQGIVAKTKQRQYVPFEELLKIPKDEPAFFLVLDGVEDPRNFGAIIRSALAVGVHGIVIQKHRAVGLTPEAIKASAGASEYISISAVPNIKYAIDAMKEEGIYIVGAEGGSDKTPYDEDLSVPLALVVGSEGRGLRDVIRNRCDTIISLPMQGMVNSLNVSVATGVILYEILRQRMRKKKKS